MPKTPEEIKLTVDANIAIKLSAAIKSIGTLMLDHYHYKLGNVTIPVANMDQDWCREPLYNILCDTYKQYGWKLELRGTHTMYFFVFTPVGKNDTQNIR